MTDPTLVVAALVVVAGATVQGVLGFGMNLVIAPVLVLVDPTLVPVPVLIVAAALNIGVATRDRRGVHLGELSWALVGRAVGTVVGASLLVSLPPTGVAVVFAVGVLAAVAFSLARPVVHVDRRSMLVAGSASGMMATTTGVGGPPMAILLQTREGAGLRAQLGSFLMVGGIFSVVVLALAGEVAVSDLRAAAVLLPAVLLGFVISGPLRSRVDGARLRPLVLVVAAASAVALLVRTFA